MSINTKITRKSHGGGIGNLLRKLKALNNQSVETGYFKEQGRHESGLTYPELMTIHEFGIGGVERRPVGALTARIDRLNDISAIKVSLKSYFVSNGRLGASETLNDIGRHYQQKAKYIFGNTTLLPVTTNITPLIDTGELQSKWAYRVSIDNVIITN